MTLPIAVRFWIPDEGIMIKSDCIPSDYFISFNESDGTICLDYINLETDEHSCELEEVSNAVPMIRTPLKDMNGDYIYEGDLLRYPARNEWEEESFVVFEVYFHDGDEANRNVGFQMNRVYQIGARRPPFSNSG